MSGKHTPGPWSVASHERRIIHGAGGREIARAYLLGSMRTQEEAEANARLIAAAPEMLGALKIARADLSAAFRQIVGSERHSATIKAIDAAISKAEGRTEEAGE